MNQKKNNLKSRKLKRNFNNNLTQNDGDILKERLMRKYNISSEKFDEIFHNYEEKKQSENSHSIDKNAADDILKEKLMRKYNISSEKFDEIFHNYEEKKNEGNVNNKSVYQNSNQKAINKNVNVQDNKAHKDTDVDSIIEGIIPMDYNQQVAIKLNHVDLTFEVQNEKVDTLKESFIRTIKGDKSKKVKIHALDDVSFQIYKGEKVGIIGYNGAGKSTLLNVISGIYPPDNGTVVTYGNISPLLSLGAGFDSNFSGRKNIILNGAVLGYDREFLESKMNEIIEFSELGDFIDIPIKNYSNGMLAKLGFSIATSVNPDILIIDEILGVGDVNFRKKSSDKIKSLMDGGTTVLLVSHSLFQIRNLCDKAIWVDNGKIREIGEVNKVCDSYLKDAENATRAQLENIELFK